jgi:hypothetical protein
VCAIGSGDSALGGPGGYFVPLRLLDPATSEARGAARALADREVPRLRGFSFICFSRTKWPSQSHSHHGR